MTEESFKRKLTAILSADVEGYSRLMAEDEGATVRTLTTYREVMTTLIQQHNGKVLDSPGDNLLAEFASVVDAVQCAVAVQKEISTRNAELAENRKMQFRIGINLGDVIQEEDRIYGDGVNIAARLEGLADPGGICISKTAFDHIESKLPYGYEYLGDQTVKNIPKPVGAYRVLMEPRVTVAEKPEEEKPVLKRRKPILVVAIAVLVLMVAVGIWYLFVRPTEPPIETASVEKMAFPLPDKPSIVVLPFTNMSGDPEQEYFSDGMTDDLITDLSKISGLFVVARNSSFLYKGKPVKIKKIAEELGIRYVLEGSVRKAGNKIRINAQFIDATTGGHLWAERYDRDYKDIFGLQDEVIQRIVFALSITLTEAEKEQLARKYTDNLEAYDYYLRGEQSVHSFSVKGLAKARSMLQKAIDLDPKFAQAYAAHALTSLYMWDYNLTKSGLKEHDDRNQAFQYATKALALDISLPMAHSVWAKLHLLARRFDEAIASADKAVALEPSNADSYVTKADVYSSAGRHEEALETINMAFRLNPNPPPYYYFTFSGIQFYLRQYIECIESVKKIGHAIPDYFLSIRLVPSYAHLGRLKEARTELKKYIKGNPFPSLEYIRHPEIHLLKLGEDVKHRYEGFRKAGLQEMPFGYRRSMEEIVENMFEKEEIKALAVGRTWSGFNLSDGEQWRIHFAEDGKLNPGGAWGPKVGSYWIEEYRICWKWQGSTKGKAGCGFVYPNPTGTAEKKNEYEWGAPEGAYPFSIED